MGKSDDSFTFTPNIEDDGADVLHFAQSSLAHETFDENRPTMIQTEGLAEPS